MEPCTFGTGARSGTRPRPVERSGTPGGSARLLAQLSDGPATQVLTADALRTLRLRAQRLDCHRPSAGVAGVVRDVFALQAQDATAATLGIWSRSDGLSVGDVTRARERDRSVVRVWCLRGTLHLVATEDVRWLLDLLRPGLVNANRTRRAELGLDDDATARGVRAVLRMLSSEGCLTRREIADGLARLGIPSAGQATIHILWRAALDGLVCYGPDRHGEFGDWRSGWRCMGARDQVADHTRAGDRDHKADGGAASGA